MLIFAFFLHFLILGALTPPPNSYATDQYCHSSHPVVSIPLFYLANTISLLFEFVINMAPVPDTLAKKKAGPPHLKD